MLFRMGKDENGAAMVEFSIIMGLLFALTFVINTGAEVIRHRLRRRYARL